MRHIHGPEGSGDPHDVGEVNGCISDVLVIELLHSWSHWFGEEQCMSFLVLHKCMF
jgi:hypothetical protein